MDRPFIAQGACLEFGGLLRERGRSARRPDSGQQHSPGRGKNASPMFGRKFLAQGGKPTSPMLEDAYMAEVGGIDKAIPIRRYWPYRRCAKCRRQDCGQQADQKVWGFHGRARYELYSEGRRNLWLAWPQWSGQIDYFQDALRPVAPHIWRMFRRWR